MKLLKYIPVALMAMMAFGSCDSDLDKVTYNEADAKVGSLNAIESSYVLEEEKADTVVEIFKWAASTFGYDAAVTYKLVVDLSGKNFENRRVIASVIGKTESAITHRELNDILTGMDSIYHIGYGNEASYDIRIEASIGDVVTPLYTNVVTAKFTTYYPSTKPVVYIVGNGIKDVPEWSNDAAAIGNGLQLFFSDTSAKTSLVYTYTGYFLAGKALKFPIKAGDWNTGYAADGDILKPNNDGVDYTIPVTPDGLYTLEIDTKALTIKMTPYTGAVNTYTTIGIVGDGANGWPGDDNITDIA
ncbi:MAG: SusE domain-containing protein, partial [Prevotella sp.]|nr:SusE domain-containing protein [Prevotella sp.]